MSEFAFNGNAGMYSSSAQGQSVALSTATSSGAAAAALEYSQNEKEMTGAEEAIEGAGQMVGERQIELLLWLSNLSLRLPPYGDLN